MVVQDKVAYRSVGYDPYAGAVKTGGVFQLERPGVPSELAGAPVFLASGVTNYTAGETITIDGGWTVGEGVKA